MQNVLQNAIPVVVSAIEDLCWMLPNIFSNSSNSSSLQSLSTLPELRIDMEESLFLNWLFLSFIDDWSPPVSVVEGVEMDLCGSGVKMLEYNFSNLNGFLKIPHYKRHLSKRYWKMFAQLQF